MTPAFAIAAAGSAGRRPPPRASTSRPTATALPAPTATLTRAQRDQRCAPLADVREPVVRPGASFGQRLRFSGEIATLQVAPPGRIYELGDQKSREFETVIYVRVPAPEGSPETVVVGYDGGTSGMFEGTAVVVYGTMVDTDSHGENAFGNEVSVPFIVADRMIEQSAATP